MYLPKRNSSHVKENICEKDVDYEGMFWNYTERDTELNLDCPQGYTGAESLLSVIDEFAIRLYNSRASSDVTQVTVTPNIGENVTTFVGLVYKNLSQAVSTKLDQAENATISSQVLSLHLLPQAPVKLDPEIQLNFQTFQN
ncbi:hypothetical protein MAR_018172 [Mya arenaria]|uniref:Uncharacterized protein n=1 Tax=Mya arenaria TaxID=6604 RepID=A0ABY7EGK8_MYAAR|nr:hypothetical protein MAR_018172 [Mya arenaria]